MLNQIISFFRSEDGAVTVDWVVLTALVVGLAVVAITSIEGATGSVGSAVMNFLTGSTVG